MIKEIKSENTSDPTVQLNLKIKEIEDELAKTREKMAVYMKELGYGG